MSGFEIRLMQRLDKSYYFELKVRSEKQPKVKSLGILEADDADTVKVGALAAAMAEELCEKYSDTLDPAFVARQAARAYVELGAENPTVHAGDIERWEK